MSNRKRNSTTWVAKPLLDRFKSKYRIDVSGCWIWTGTILKSGYGRLKNLDGKQMPAHRISYEIHHGPIPSGKLVMHSCDQRACVCPTHLQLGSHADNMADMKRKLRGPMGDRNTNAKLDADKVREIRGLFGKVSIDEIAGAYHVTPAAVCMAICRYTWRHVE